MLHRQQQAEAGWMTATKLAIDVSDVVKGFAWTALDLLPAQVPKDTAAFDLLAIGRQVVLESFQPLSVVL